MLAAALLMGLCLAGCGEATGGTTAAAEAGVPGLPADVLRLMGALAFRTSFTQNVLRHSVEVALLMGTMAAEMGLDAARARRTAAQSAMPITFLPRPARLPFQR